MPTFCNPLNLDYQFVVPDRHDAHNREAADPSVVRYRGRYWLFASKSGGYWHSDDLRNWTHVPTAVLPAEDYAPDVRVIDDWLVFTASRRGDTCPIYRTRQPEADTWEKVAEELEYWDPNLFQDADGRVYLYYGCSDQAPIYGVELDRHTFAPLGEPQALLPAEPEAYGFERFGENNTAADPPWIEGAWVTPHAGRYYLQYAVPGTDFNVYCDAVAVGEAPLGPFVRQASNPFSFKPGGFLTGAGHGSTFADPAGDLWHVSTMRLSVQHIFERRLGLWPAGFDDDGVLLANTRFGDYPHRLPDGARDGRAGTFTGWMLLSLAKPATASVSVEGAGPEYAFDEDGRTAWVAPDRQTGHWLAVDLGAEARLRAVQINFAERDCDHRGPARPAGHRYRLEGSRDGQSWFDLADKRDNDRDVPHDYVELPHPTAARHVRLTIHRTAGGGRPAVSGLRVFGHGSGPAPKPAEGLTVHRHAEDPCVAELNWKLPPRAHGVHVLWGTGPEKLYNAWLVYGRESLTMRCLAAGQNYHFAVEAFGEGGVAALSPTIEA